MNGLFFEIIYMTGCKNIAILQFVPDLWQPPAKQLLVLSSSPFL